MKNQTKFTVNLITFLSIFHDQKLIGQFLQAAAIVFLRFLLNIHTVFCILYMLNKKARANLTGPA